MKAARLHAAARHIPVFEDFSKHGLRDWASTPHGGISTYKFREPARSTPGKDHALRVTVTVPRERLCYRFRVGKRQFLANVRGPQETFLFNRNLKVGETEILLRPTNFQSRDRKTMQDWNEVSTFRFDIYDGSARQSLHSNDPANLKLISRIEWVKE